MSNTDSDFVLRTISIHDGRKMVIVCDSDIIGTCFEEGKKVLDCTNSFFKGEPASEEQIVAEINKAHLLNITGTKSIALALKLKIISEDNILTIGGTPHAEAAYYHD